MDITEIRIKLMDSSEDRLRAFCSITFDNCFVVRDLKIIEGNNGPFVAMPSRKLTSHCRDCRYKNHLRAKFCNQCGTRLPSDQVDFDSQGRAKLYADVAHPINAESREAIQDQVVTEFDSELERAKLPGYCSKYDDTYESDDSLPVSIPTPRIVQSGNTTHRTDAASSKVPSPHQQDADSNKTAFSKSQNTNSESGKLDNSDADNEGLDKESDFGEGIFD